MTPHESVSCWDDAWYDCPKVAEEGKCWNYKEGCLKSCGLCPGMVDMRINIL